MQKVTLLAAVVATGLVTTGSAHAALTTVGASNDTWIRDGYSYTANGVDPVLRADSPFVPYVQFDLSGLAIDTISDGVLTLYKQASTRNDNLVTGRFAVYGLTNAAGNTPQDWTESGVEGVNDGRGLDFRDVGAEWSPTAPNGVVRSQLFSLDADDGANVVESVSNTGPTTLTGPDLIAFLNERVDDNGFVTFIIPTEANNGTGYGWASRQNGDAALHPTLTLDYTAIPEPSVLSLAGIAGLGMLRRRRR